MMNASKRLSGAIYTWAPICTFFCPYGFGRFFHPYGLTRFPSNIRASSFCTFQRGHIWLIFGPYFKSFSFGYLFLLARHGLLVFVHTAQLLGLWGFTSAHGLHLSTSAPWRSSWPYPLHRPPGREQTRAPAGCSGRASGPG